MIIISSIVYSDDSWREIIKYLNDKEIQHFEYTSMYEDGTNIIKNLYEDLENEKKEELDKEEKEGKEQLDDYDWENKIHNVK